MTATVSLSEVAEPASALSLRDVQHTFAANKVVKGIDLDIAQGEVVCLLGPSGCGKTTLLRIAAGLEVVQEGTVSLEGQAIAAPGKRHVPPEKRNVGLAFQDSALFPHLSVLENVTFGLKHLPSSQRRERALELLTQLGMADYADTYPHMLSGGQQQRV
ncbi:MAG TPA: ABC transporter ATP-binding protein, partial [Halomonas sp.]|nr:ABC transporter ATP-binding protein [Halomonas sp.]